MPPRPGRPLGPNGPRPTPPASPDAPRPVESGADRSQRDPTMRWSKPSAPDRPPARRPPTSEDLDNDVLRIPAEPARRAPAPPRAGEGPAPRRAARSRPAPLPPPKRPEPPQASALSRSMEHDVALPANRPPRARPVARVARGRDGDRHGPERPPAGTPGETSSPRRERPASPARLPLEAPPGDHPQRIAPAPPGPPPSPPSPSLRTDVDRPSAGPIGFDACGLSIKCGGRSADENLGPAIPPLSPAGWPLSRPCSRAASPRMELDAADACRAVGFHSPPHDGDAL